MSILNHGHTAQMRAGCIGTHWALECALIVWACLTYPTYPAFHEVTWDGRVAGSFSAGRSSPFSRCSTAQGA
ncbi:hypothetical protein [Corynebacterium flavescens]|uniref:hypothetical protein n=1 Tax=Corynebacterium flavescens TaxID=28028 RepID=UPI003FD5099E